MFLYNAICSYYFEKVIGYAAEKEFWSYHTFESWAIDFKKLQKEGGISWRLRRYGSHALFLQLKPRGLKHYSISKCSKCLFRFSVSLSHDGDWNGVIVCI